MLYVAIEEGTGEPWFVKSPTVTEALMAVGKAMGLPPGFEEVDVRCELYAVPAGALTDDQACRLMDVTLGAYFQPKACAKIGGKI
jgi:hypothetical protein